MAPRSRIRVTLALLVAAPALGACNSSTELSLEPVASGQVNGVSFTVVGGTVYQATANGPIYADASGGRLVFTQTPAGLGMSDPDMLQLRTQFALAAGGTVQIAAFADAGNEFATGLSVLIERSGADLFYEMRSDGAVLVDSVFVPPPPVPSAETWVLTEFYADSVPGVGSGQSGITMWNLDNLAPTNGSDVLGCGRPPAVDASIHPGNAVGYQFASGWILSVSVVNQIVGPCP